MTIQRAPTLGLPSPPSAPIRSSDGRPPGAAAVGDVRNGGASAAHAALRAIAQEFESMLLRQMFESSGLAGTGSGSGPVYGAMATDALATGVSRGGGLGLAAMLERALSRSLPTVAAAPTPDSPPAHPATSSQRSRAG